MHPVTLSQMPLEIPTSDLPNEPSSARGGFASDVTSSHYALTLDNTVSNNQALGGNVETDPLTPTSGSGHNHSTLGEAQKNNLMESHTPRDRNSEVEKANEDEELEENLVGEGEELELERHEGDPVALDSPSNPPSSSVSPDHSPLDTPLSSPSPFQLFLSTSRKASISMEEDNNKQ